jgi:hypothetical protein
MDGMWAVQMLDLLRLIEREVGPVSVTARVNIEMAVEHMAYDDEDDGNWWDEGDDEPDPEPVPPVDPDDDPGEKPDLYALFDLKVPA